MALSKIDVSLMGDLFDHAPDVAFFVKDVDGCYVAVNHSLVKRHGFNDKADVIGKRPDDICFGDFGRLPCEQDDRVLRTGRPLLEQLEMQWYRPNDPVWCMTTKLPIRDATNRVTGLVGFSRDVRVPVQRDEIPRKFAEALNEFELGLFETVTPAWLAERSEMTSQQLTRLTKRVLGLTPSQLITKTRVATASRLLRETDKSVATIALDCGFYDHSAFTRAFRTATGVTPIQFRKQ
ncbi:HTH-type transcriptional regulator CdhR [Rubripirellula lacrimiformis]|uniref:HTH-type transcriptional regulator CdhR n=1 Tax=Rubripirellula lacrimiformis TaxID=1930273 RepID=A0A517N957_9BACT|nr:helix-turn-helix domain-containing protein [Rubripirellula lacrimiformis]QDT03677.1 HTH-type transcriptional regulator CdhR [Rubripirellula lacrimiformis]